MNEVIERYKGCSIRVSEEDYPESPREWGNLGTMVCAHSRYNLGDVQRESGYEVDEYIEENFPDVCIAMNLYLYDHSWITMRCYPFNDRWDSGQVGVIVVTKEAVRKEYGVKRISKKLREKVKELLVSEVEVYDMFLRGDVYRYWCEDDNGDTIASCGEYFGYDMEKSGLLEAARDAIDHHIFIQDKFATERLDYVAQFCENAPINALLPA